MKPLGQKKIQLPDAKHHPKEKGKHLGGWWENIIEPSKTTDKQQAKKDIVYEINNIVGENIVCEIVSINDLSTDELIRLRGYRDIISKVYNKWPLVEQYTFKQVINFEGKNILVEDVEKVLSAFAKHSNK